MRNTLNIIHWIIVRLSTVLWLAVFAACLGLRPNMGQGAELSSGDAAQQVLTFVQITDTHIPQDKAKLIDDDNAYDNLLRAVDEINTLESRPEFVIHTGDIAHSKGFPEEYENFKEAIAGLQIPIQYLLGNHDNRANFRSLVLDDTEPSDTPYYYSFDRGEWHFVCLDSLIPGKSPGRIPDDELAWLERDLAASRDKTVLIFLHHHVLRLQAIPNKLDNLMLLNNKQFLELISGFPNVKYVVNGHVHLSKVVTKGGVTFVSTPSLAYQFSPIATKLERIDAPPCYRIFTLKSDGQVEMALKPLGHAPRKEMAAPPHYSEKVAEGK